FEIGKAQQNPIIPCRPHDLVRIQRQGPLADLMSGKEMRARPRNVVAGVDVYEEIVVESVDVAPRGFLVEYVVIDHDRRKSRADAVEGLRLRVLTRGRDGLRIEARPSRPGP